MSSLNNKIIVLTGATGGIGSSSAELLAKEKAILFLTAINRDKLAKLQKKLQKQTVTEAYTADLAKEAEVKKLAQYIQKKFKRIDVLIHTAAVFHIHPLHEFTASQFAQTMDVNVKSIFLLVKYLLGLLKKSQSAHLIIVASISAHHGWLYGGAYCASKSALVTMAQSLREELTKYGIRVSVVSPGQVDTKMSLYSPDNIKRKSMLHPQDVGELILYAAKLTKRAYFSEVIIRPVGL